MFPSTNGMKMNTEKILSLVRQYDMLPPGSRVLCAVSGGADSVCLLHFLSCMPGISVMAAHFNHCLRGGESDRDELFTKSLAESLHILFAAGRGDVAGYAALHGMGTEEAARRLRYEFLEKTASELGCDKIATAHNANDNAETVVMSLARGAGLRGMCGIPPVRGRLIRPLLNVTRSEIESYLEQNGLGHVEDSTNASDDYARNRVRHHVLPVLESINSSAIMNISRSCENARRAMAMTESMAEKFIRENENNGELPVSLVRELPETVQAEVFAKMCPETLSEKHISALRGICRDGVTHASADVHGLRVTRERERLIFAEADERKIVDAELEPGTETVIKGTKLAVKCEFIANCDEINNSFNTFCFKSESICGKILVTSRREGDEIRLAGRGCTKSLKKLMTEAKTPTGERSAIPVFRDEEKIVAVYGFGMAERCLAVPGDNVIKITVRRTDGRSIND